jgi:hypothetical protein
VNSFLSTPQNSFWNKNGKIEKIDVLEKNIYLGSDHHYIQSGMSMRMMIHY